MKVFKQFNHRGFLVFALDIIVITASLFVSWIIRAQFREFLYDMYKVLYMLPYVLFFRSVTNIFFEHYALSFRRLHGEDIFSLFFHSLVPTAIFTGLRFLSPEEWMRIPLSMIFTEYFFSVIGMVFVRTVVIRLLQEKTRKVSGHISTALLVGELNSLSDYIERGFFSDNRFDPVGIVNENPMDWDQDYRGIRVFQGIDSIPDIVGANPNIESVIIAGELYYSDKVKLITLSNELNLSLSIVEDDTVRPADARWVLHKSPSDISFIPEEINDSLSGRKVFIAGAESVVCRALSDSLDRLKDVEIDTVSAVSGVGVPESKKMEAYDAVVDLRLSFLFEYGCDVNGSDAQFSLNQLAAACEKAGPVIIPLPYDVYKTLRSGLSGVKECTFLITGGIITENAFRLKNSAGNVSFWDQPEHVAGAVLKVLSLIENGKNGLFYFRSHDAFAVGERDSIEDIYTLEATPFFGLYRLQEK